MRTLIPGTNPVQQFCSECWSYFGDTTQPDPVIRELDRAEFAVHTCTPWH